MPFNDAFAVDAYASGGDLTGPLPSKPMAVMNVDVHLATTPAILGREANDFPSMPMATMNVDTYEIVLPYPGRLKVWDGAQWVPIRNYYFDSVAQAWVPTG